MSVAEGSANPRLAATAVSSGKREPKSILPGSLDGVDRPLLYATIKELLANEDGCIRGLVASVYPMLSPEDAKALLPEIVKATHTTAPSGEMFAYGIPRAYRSHRPLAESLPCWYLLIHDLDTF